ncbi:hypothetical protein SEA_PHRAPPUCCINO_151 [Mycobacterium phage Phrappuccino]|uniref:Uncharacterized protein n=1 Tax=Mycobacterium phage Phrappuccino TaxID=2591223 RepID=A0A514DDZ1_9CAUD|nr:hypothetical protein KHQ87_gp151 [Mycobacterium phage Phrappuccino]QDH91826.1 hypothetical protein SEA_PHRAPPUCCINO_151 [Mycobacterium phage Phrappuccino]QIQ63268.1 hypothetical protein SEA_SETTECANDELA_151 [Mycobacterium phage Settecandela]
MKTVFDITALAERVGRLPDGDAPQAWFVSDAPEVLAAYEKAHVDYKHWVKRTQELAKDLGITGDRAYFSGFNGEYLKGLYPDTSYGPVPEGWRREKKGYLVPVRKTKADRTSEANKRMNAVRKVPRTICYLPGMPDYAWGDHRIFSGRPVRDGDKAVVVLFGYDPFADERFAERLDTDTWDQYPLSVYHLLKENQ